MDAIPLNLTLSNRLEFLFDRLKPYLFENRLHPLSKILIIVPSQAMKSWIFQQSSLKAQIAFGFEVVLLHDAIRKLSNSNFYSLLSKQELAIRIENELQAMDSHPFISSLKIANIAEELAEVFLTYGEYYPHEMEKWKKNPSHWQSILWNKIYSSTNEPLYSYLNNLKVADYLPLQIHLFGFSYISNIKQQFFEKLNFYIPIHYWILSPSRMLWSDHKSCQEQVFFMSLLQKRGINFSQIQELQKYLEESNALIGNNGRLGRKWREKMEEGETITAEIYGVAEALFSHPHYENRLLDGVIGFSSSGFQILETVQADLTLLATHDEPLSLNSNDRSIEIHSAPSRFREVEVLYEILLKSCSDQNISPGDILVMTPELELYAPFIKTIFNRKESQLPFEIMEQNSLDGHSFIQTFFSLMDFAESRWEIDPLFEILKSPHFHEKNSISIEDLSEIQTLLSKAGVRWGLDRSHRELICQNPLIESTHKGSWKGGIESLCKSLIYKNDQSKVQLKYAQSETLSLFLDLVQNLKQDLYFACDDSLRSIDEWKKILHHFMEKYLGSYQDEEVREEFLQIIRKLPGKEILSFKSLLVYLKSLAKETLTVYRSKNLQAVRFCPLLPMRAIPSQVIGLLGMNCEVFPRIERKSPLFMAEPTTYIPNPTDYDRYLFLESLLSARKKWILSYVKSDEDMESSLIQELLNYLDTNYRIGDQLPSIALTFEHPEISFDSRYFMKGSKYYSSSLTGYKAALSYRNAKHIPSIEIHAPLPASALDPNRLPQHLTVSQLKSFIYNPIKHHLNQTHGIYLQKDEKPHRDMEEFSEEKLWDSEWLKWALKYPIDKVLDLAEIQSKFPCAPFKEPAKERLKKNLQEQLKKLSALEIHPQDIFEVEFSYDCKTLKQISSQYWKVPPVEINYRGRVLCITGVLPYICKKGFLSLREKKKETFFQMLPELLLLQEIPKDLVNPAIIFVKSGDSHALKTHSWTLFLDHYLRSLHQPIPHTPIWIAHILNENPEALHQSIKLSCNDPFLKKSDPYVNWVFPKVESIDCSKLIKDWKEETALHYGAFYE